MRAYILRRLLWMVPTLLGAVTFIFVIMHILPGDISLVILGAEGRAPDPEQLAALREQLGLNRPLYEQYVSWLWGLVRLDLGTSLWTGEAVAKEIWIRLPYTLSLIALAIIISGVLALPIGVISALKQDTWADHALRAFAIAGLSIPSFWFAILIVLFLLMVFRWFPPLTYAPIYQNPAIALQQLIFPAIALGYRQTAVAARMLRSSMLEVLREDYVRTARAKGLEERTVIYLHALKNAVLPVITVFGLEAIILFSGAVIVETIFKIPGVGTLVVQAIVRRDVPLVQGVVLVTVLFVLVVNLAIDLIYAWVDPRIRYR